MHCSRDHRFDGVAYGVAEAPSLVVNGYTRCSPPAVKSGMMRIRGSSGDRCACGSELIWHRFTY
jgi:hypothetical protein